MGWGTLRPPPILVFCPLLKISLGNPYLKILDLTKLFIVDTPMKKKKIVLPPLRNKYVRIFIMMIFKTLYENAY